jgi:hypothetical protein
MPSSLILPAMKKTAILAAILLAGAVPAAAQSTEFGVLFGGSARSTESNTAADDVNLADDFSLSHNSVAFYYGIELEPGTMFKLRAGRIETPVGLATVEGARHDVEGEVEHLDAIAEYRFSEPFGSAGLFAGIGLYRQTGSAGAGLDEVSETDYGFLAGVTADFPLSRRYGVILDATHHWTKLPFKPRYLTVSGGLRLRF